MKSSVCITGLAGIAVSLSVHADEQADRLAAIQDALNHGAVIVECKETLCRNTQTNEVVGKSLTNGAYLVYPNDQQHQEDIQRAQRALAKSN